MNKHKHKTRSKTRRSRKAMVACVVIAVAVVIGLLLGTGYGRRLTNRVRNAMQMHSVTVPYAQSYGIDVSHYQGEIDWTKVKTINFNIATRRQTADDKSASVGIDFVFAKSTEGATEVDEYLEKNRDGAHKAGLRFGVYHVLSLKKAQQQYQNFIKNAKLVPGDLVPVIDIEEEWVGKADIAKVRETVKELAKLMTKKYGQKPIIYCGQSYGQELFGRDKELGGYPKWIPRYNTGQRPSGADIWQYAQTGTVAGITGEVDLDALYSEQHELEDYILK